MSQSTKEIRVCLDIGSVKHRVGIGFSDGEIFDEFDLNHESEEIKKFFSKVEQLEKQHQMPIVFAMEGYGGYARPIDQMCLKRNYKLMNVNNMKLARFKEIFPGPAKSDPIDVRKMFELFKLQEALPTAKGVLQEVFVIPEVNRKLQLFSRRRRELVTERAAILNRMQTDLHAIAPGLLSITKQTSNLWFLNFLTSSDSIKKLSRLRRKSLLNIKGVGQKYADIIQEWQKTASFSPDVSWNGQMIIRDAKRILQLTQEISELEKLMEELIPQSQIATRILSIGGFGLVCAAELAGEIGTVDRFPSEASLALYIGMAVLDKQSGKYHGSRTPRHVNWRAKGAMMVGIDHHRKIHLESQKYYEKKRSEGKKHNQAIRALGRHMVRVIYSMIKNDRDYIAKDMSAQYCFKKTE